MKLSLTYDTLAYQLGVRPSLQNRDMGKAPLPSLCAAISEFRALDNAYDWLDTPGKSEKPMGDPQKDAVITYLLQDAVFQIQKKIEPLEPLGKYLPILELYHEQTALRATRMFYYLVLICARESRHSNTEVYATASVKLSEKYGEKVTDFHQGLRKLGESEAVAKLLTQAPQVPIKLWLGFMADHFRKSGGHNYGHAFGGDMWASIADVAFDFATGNKPAQLMLDVAFALQHNTAAIFNKGMLYSHHTAELAKILDVQRSGQIPQLLAEQGIKKTASADVLSMYQTCKIIEGFDGVGYVDWYKVEADCVGLEKGNHKYPMEKKEQALLHGVPGSTKIKQEVAAMKQGLANQAVVEEALAMVQIFPNEFIKKVKRENT